LEPSNTSLQSYGIVKVSIYFIRAVYNWALGGVEEAREVK